MKWLLGLFGGAWWTYGKWIALGLAFMGMLWFVHNEGKKSERSVWEPQLITCQNDYKEFRTEVKHNTEMALQLKNITEELYLAKLGREKLINEIEFNDVARSLDEYESQRLRDKEVLRASSSRIYSLSSLLEIADSKNRQAELAARLEYVNQGFAKLAFRGDTAIQRTIQCKREIMFAPGVIIVD